MSVPPRNEKSMRYARLFADDSGESHFDDIEIEFTATDYVQSAAPLDFSVTFPASQVAFMRAPAGWASEFHVSSARNMFVVLSGTLEVRDGDTIVSVLRAGDTFGEMAFLLERPRSFHVDASTDDARILSLSEGALRTMIAEDATIAAKLLLNLSKMLCVKLIQASH